MTDEMNISNEELVDEPVEAAEATEAEESAAGAPEGAQPVEGAAETGEADPVVADEPQAADGAAEPIEQAEVAEPAQEDDGGEAGDAYTADVADLVSDGMGDDALGLALGGLGTVSPAVVDRSGLETMLNASLAAVEASYQTLEALSYAARTWRDDTTEGPWLNATNLNSMDGQIETLTDAVNTLNTNIEAVKDDLETLGESVSQSTSAENLISAIVPAGESRTLLHPINQYRLVALRIGDANDSQNTRNRLVFRPDAGAFYMPVAVAEAFQAVRFEASGTTFNFLGNTGSTKLYIRNMFGIR